MYLGNSTSDRRAQRDARTVQTSVDRAVRQEQRDIRQAERQADALLRRMREPVSTVETQEIPGATPAMPQMLPSEIAPTPGPSMQTPYGTPGAMETVTEEPAPADNGGIVPWLLGGGLLLLLL